MKKNKIISKGLYSNIDRRKKLSISRSKKKSTLNSEITLEAYKNLIQ